MAEGTGNKYPVSSLQKSVQRINPLSKFLAEGTGFEPAKLLTCWFSRPVPSTTRPPFHH